MMFMKQQKTTKLIDYYGMLFCAAKIGNGEVAKNEGIERLAEYVLRNQKNGIMYGWNKDYDNLGNEEAVIDLLHNGLNSKYAK